MIWRWFWREWRSPSLLIVWIALTLSVASVFALTSLGSRMEKGLAQQGRAHMAGDRTLRTHRAVDQRWLDTAEKMGLTVGKQFTFMSVTFAKDQPQLADVKAVDERYPLAGQLVTRPANLTPQPGTVLVASRLLTLLNVQPGEMLDVGDSTLRIAGELLQEPDSGFNPFQPAPRVIVSLSDVEKTVATQPGSRVIWYYKFSGSAEQLARYDAWISSRLTTGQIWRSAQNSEDPVGYALQHAQQFLLLSALLTLLLAIAAVAVAMSHYCRSRYDRVAVLKTLGATRGALHKFIVGQWLSVLLLAAVAGIVIGLAEEALLIQMLKSVLPGTLPAAGGKPWIWALGALVLISLLTGLRPYRLLLATPPLRVLRHDAITAVWPLKYYLPVMAIFVTGALAWLLQDNKLLWILTAGMAILALLLGGIAWGGLLLLRRLAVRRLSSRLAINRLLRQPVMTLSQLAAFSLSFMLLALLLLMRNQLLPLWQQQIPPDSPNYFLVNITQQQIPLVDTFLRQHQVTPGTFYPIIRGRLTEINHHPANPAQDNALSRELNLTWLSQPPDHNLLVAGSWPPPAGGVSMEAGLASRLNVGVGDTLTFTGDTQTFSANITSLRQVDWQSMRPNFLFIFPPGSLDDQPQSWMTSFRSESATALLAQLNQRFPELTVLDMGGILQQIEQVLTEVGRALQIMVVLVTAAGILLLLAQIQVGMLQRRQELRVYRTLGASKRLLQGTLWFEFTLLGGMSGLAAALGAESVMWGLQHYLFDFPWQPNVMMWILLPLGGSVLLALIGCRPGTHLLKGKALFRRD